MKNPPNSLRHLLTRILVSIVLHLNHWRPVTLGNGEPGWETTVVHKTTGVGFSTAQSQITTLRGNSSYALSRLLG